MHNHFKTQITESYSKAPSTKIRWEKSLTFVGDLNNVISALDVGDVTGLTKMMENKFGIKFDNSKGDLDSSRLTGKYDLVTSFEVLEHLFNPLFHLEQIHEILEHEGRLILSTPLAKPRFLWSDEHFHEMSKKSIYALFEAAKFKIIRQEFFKIYPFSFYLRGVRPLLRLLFDRIQIYELRPIRSSN